MHFYKARNWVSESLTSKKPKPQTQRYRQLHALLFKEEVAGKPSQLIKKEKERKKKSSDKNVQLFVAIQALLYVYINPTN